MKKTRILVIILSLSFIMIWGCGNNKTGNYDRLFRPASAEYYHVPVGLCEDYPEETTTMEIIRSDMEFLKETGIDLLRISFGWDAIEHQKDQYDWLFWDDFVRLAVEEYGITLIPYICYMPRWNSRGAADSLYFWNYPPVDPNQFGEFTSDLVSRYKQWIKTWELWNEPDIWIYWQGTPEEFAEMISIGAKAVKRSDPEAKVVLGGVAYDENFVATLFRDHGLSPYIDVVNMHNYYETWSGQPVENIDDHIRKMSEVIQMYGDHQPIWVAEVGYSTFRQDLEVSSEYTAYYDYGHTPEYQAVDLFKRLALIVSTNKVSAIAWYEIKDLPYAEEVIGDEYNNRHLGVAYEDYSPKPAQNSLMFFNQLFSKPYKSITDQVYCTKPADSDSHVLVFQQEDGTVIVVAWLQTHIPEKRTVKSAGNVKDNRKEIISISLPCSLTGKAFLYDHLGTESAWDAVKTEQGKTILEGVELQGGEIKIIKIEKE